MTWRCGESDIHVPHTASIKRCVECTLRWRMRSPQTRSNPIALVRLRGALSPMVCTVTRIMRSIMLLRRLRLESNSMKSYFGWINPRSRKTKVPKPRTPRTPSDKSRIYAPLRTSKCRVLPFELRACSASVSDDLLAPQFHSYTAV